MPKPGDERAVAPGGAEPGEGTVRPPRQRWAESVPKPDQTRSLDFTARARPAVDEAQARERVVEAAMHYAAGEPARAKASLLGGLEASPERAWLMLLELHQELGEGAQFASRAREFESRFGRAAPPWREPPRPEEGSLRTGGAAYVALSGRLSAQSAAQLDKLRAVARQYPQLRIDFAKLQGADGAGCTLLRELLHAIRRGGGEAAFTGEGTLLEALARATRSADRQVDPAFWLLRLEMLQSQGRRSEFESVARQYADTYAVPAPEFEAPGVAPSVLGPAGELRAPEEIVENADAFLREIVAAGQRREQVIVDCSDLRRVDVASARSLRQLAAGLEEHGKRLELREVNALVVALLEAIGVSAVSTVVPRM